MRKKNMQERTNKRVQTITQNIDKAKGCKTKKEGCITATLLNNNST